MQIAQMRFRNDIGEIHSHNRLSRNSGVNNNGLPTTEKFSTPDKRIRVNLVHCFGVGGLVNFERSG